MAKSVVTDLVRAIGGEALDAGPLAQAAHLEAMAAVVIRLLFGGAHTGTTFNLEERPILQVAATAT